MRFPTVFDDGAILARDLGFHVSFGLGQVAAWIDENPERRIFGIESTVEHWVPDPTHHPQKTRERSVIVIWFWKGDKGQKAN